LASALAKIVVPSRRDLSNSGQTRIETVDIVAAGAEDVWSGRIV
jgi:hypothetical protein